MSAAEDEAVRVAITDALTPFAGKPLSPENVEAMTVKATDALVAYEATLRKPLSRAECRGIVERSIGKMLEVVAVEMAREEKANAPGGDA